MNWNLTKLDFDRYVAERRTAVNHYLNCHLPAEDTYPQSIYRAMRYSLFAGGKRLRPVLTIVSAEVVGGDIGDAMPAAAAIEMIHTYSLIHDDLPAMDNDSLRRGKPTSHVVFGEAVAILAGDALLTEAFHLLASAPLRQAEDPERRLHAVALLARAAGVLGMVAGQVVDLESEGKQADAETLEFIHRHKTGALMGAAAELGALAGGADEPSIERLGGFGRALGLAFQIVDDILDVEGDAASLGKSAGKDREAGKVTYPGVHGLDAARRRARELSEQAVELLSPFGSAAEPLIWMARTAIDRRS